MRTHSLLAAFLLAALPATLAACSSETDAAGEATGAVSQGKEVTALGPEGAKVTFTTIYQDSQARQPIDLDFNPEFPGDAWVLNYADDSVTVLRGLDTDHATLQNRHDPAAGHFMHRPPQIAFGVVGYNNAGTWATCGDGNNGGNFFMGPSLFSSSLDIFAYPTPGGLGSHLDMLHLTSYCRGIAHETGNVYYTYNAQFGSIERYDFVDDHGPGADDHSDGKAKRYVTGQLTPVNGIPSQLAWDAERGLLYIADSGSGRILALDPNSGTVGGRLRIMEPMAEALEIRDASLTEVVPAGTLQIPSGLKLHNGILYVTDTMTGKFHAFTRDGELLRTVETGLQPASLAGLTIGPDGKVWFVDRRAARVLRLDVEAAGAEPQKPAVSEEQAAE